MKLFYTIVIFLLIIAGCGTEAPPEDSEASDASGSAPPMEDHPDDDIRTLRLYMESHDVEYLYDRAPDNDKRIPAHAKLDDDDEALALEGVRFRGNTTRLREKKPFNIEFSKPQEFLDGSDRLNLNAMFTDPSMMREQLAFDMFEKVGVDAPDTEYYRLYINDRYEGLYTRVERIDENFLENRGMNPAGTLIRDRMRSHRYEVNSGVKSTFAYSLGNVGEKAEQLELIFDYRGSPNWLKYGDFHQWVADTPAGENFAQELSTHVDLENYMNFLAIHFIIGDTDSFGDDYWMYLDHQDPEGKWKFIPWDKDLTMGSVYRSRDFGGIANDFFYYENPVSTTWDNVLIEKTLATDALREQLEAHILTLMETELSPDFMAERIEAYEQLIDDEMETDFSSQAFQLHDQNHFGAVEDYDDRKKTVSEYFKLRKEYLTKQFDAPEDAAPSYHASASVESNEPIYLTDERGFVLAEIVPSQISGSPSIELEASAEPDVAGVKRKYTLTVEGGRIEADIGLYYRRDADNSGKGSWIGDSQDLDQLYSLKVFSEDSTLESTSNPYINKVTFTDVLEGTTEYTMEFGE